MTPPEASRGVGGSDPADDRDRPEGDSTTPGDAARQARHRDCSEQEEPETGERQEGAELLDYEPEPEGGGPDRHC